MSDLRLEPAHCDCAGYDDVHLVSVDIIRRNERKKALQEAADAVRCENAERPDMEMLASRIEDLL